MDFIPLPTQGEVLLQIVLAVVFGMLLGVERVIAGKTAGMRTFALVSLGSCLFVIISVFVSIQNYANFNFDPLRVASTIVTGIGFLGAGLIIMKENHLRGLTTAAGLWVAAGIGMAVGFRLYQIAFYTTLLTLAVFTILWFLEERIKSWPHRRTSQGAPATTVESVEDQ